MYLQLTLCLFLVLSGIANAEKHKIYGTVTKCGYDNIYLSNTRVFAEPVDLEVSTNSRGEYEIKSLSSGFYDLSFSKVTYRDRGERVYLFYDKDTQFDICLCPDIDLNFLTPTPLTAINQGDYTNIKIEVTGGCEPYEFSMEGELPEGLSLNPDTGNISGTVLINKRNIGNFSFVIKVQDNSGDPPYEKNYSIEVYPPLEFITESLKSLIVGYPFVHKIAVIGGTSPYTYKIMSGSLPDGVTLTTAGLLQGIPNKVGEKFFTVKVTDSLGEIISKGYTLEIVEPLQIISKKIKDAIVGTSYNMDFIATGGTKKEYQWEIVSPESPEGLVIDKDSGDLSGIPRKAGKTSITIRVSDSDGHTDEASYVFHAVKALEIISYELPAGMLDKEFSETIKISGGIPPYTFSCSDNLPNNLSLDPETGTISGMALEAVPQMPIGVVVRDSFYPESQIFEDKIILQIDTVFKFITDSVLIDAIQNKPLSIIGDFSLKHDGGIGPYTYKITDGALPVGVVGPVNLDGTPKESGDFTFTIQAIDSNGLKAEKRFDWHIIKEMNFPSKTIPEAPLLEKYHEILHVDGGVPPYKWTIPPNQLPKGLQLINTNNCWVIDGIPEESINKRVLNFQVSDSHPVEPWIKNINFELSVIDNTLSIITNMPEQKVGEAYHGTFKANSGVEPYIWALHSGILPVGMTYLFDDNTVKISGKPEEAGTFRICFKVSDCYEYSDSVTKCADMIIHGVVQIKTDTLNETSRGTDYSEAIDIENSDDSVFCSIIDGDLPQGLELDSQNCIISGTTGDNAKSQSFWLKATKPDPFGSFDVKEFSIIVPEDPTLMIKTKDVIDNLQYEPYDYPITAHGGISSYTWLISSGYLPEGLDYRLVNNSLNLTGQPTQCGFFDFSAKVFDSSSPQRADTQHFQFEIVCIDPEFDTNPPTPPDIQATYPEKEDWSNGIVTIILSPGFDEESGIRGYSYEWNNQSTCLVDNAVEITKLQIVSPMLSNGENHYFHVASVDQSGNASETIHCGPFKVEHPEGRVFIVGGGEPGDTFWNVTKTLTTNAYKDFIAMGYNHEQIDFHINTQMISIDLDEFPDDVVDDSTPTSDEIVETIQNAEHDVDVNNLYILYLQGHGANKALRISGMDAYITADQINDALDYLQSKTNCQVIVMVESCYSGSFTQTLSDHNRIILTSAGADQQYNTDSKGRIAFSRYLLSKLREEKTLKESFDYARTCMVNMGFPEPLMEDTGDGIIDENDGLADGNASQQIICMQTIFDDKPVFQDAEVIVLNSCDVQAKASLSAVEYIQIKKTFVQIIPPNSAINDGGTAIDFETITLKPKDNVFQETLVDLDQPGTYNIVFHAINEMNVSSDPYIVKLERKGDINEDDQISLLDAILALQIASGFDVNVCPAVSVNNNNQVGIVEAIFILMALSH
jgi:hypothetical protein